MQSVREAATRSACLDSSPVMPAADWAVPPTVTVPSTVAPAAGLVMLTVAGLLSTVRVTGPLVVVLPAPSVTTTRKS